MTPQLQLLLQKLPAIKAWVEGTVAAHRAAARPVASFGFPRLGSYYSDRLLNAAFAVAVPRVPMPPLTELGIPGFEAFEQLDAAGITYLDTYFIQASRLQKESLHFHELVHVVQWQHLGAERFLTAYGLGYLLGGGYLGNPLEVMAYNLQSRFERQAAAFDAETEIRRSLDAEIPQILSVISSAPGG